MAEPVTPALKPRARACPICGRPVDDTRFDPFCSRRCADVDLSRWLKGSYVIPGPPVDEGEKPAMPEDEE